MVMGMQIFTHKRWLRTVALLVLAGFMLTIGRPVAAQDDVIVQAEVDRNQVTTDDRVLLTVTLNTQPDRAPVLPPLEGFRVLGTSSASQIQIVNGVTTAFFAYRYTLQPVEVGNFRIDGVNVSIGGQNYTTNAITIEVAEGSQPLTDDELIIQPPDDFDGQDFYVEAQTAEPSAWLGEQILYTFRFFQAFDLGRRPTYAFPDFVGFWNPREVQQTQTLNNVNDRTYRISSLITPLFPTVAGELVIEPTELQMPDGTTMLTRPVVVNVNPLPEPVPENFSGAVGQFTIHTEIDKTEVEVNEAITWRIRVEGIGNIELLPEPVWPTLDGWRSFEDQSALNVEFSNAVMTGNRSYERILIPGAEGTFTIPQLDYIFFNPVSEQYEQSTSESFQVVVAGGAESAETVSSLDDTVIKDIEPLREVPARLGGQPLNLTRNPIYWLLWIVPAILVIVDKVYRMRLARSDELEEERQRLNAWRVAEQALKTARGDKATRAELAAERILNTYLSEKFNQPFVGLSQNARTTQLKSLEVRPSLIRWVNRVYDTLEGARYGYKGHEPGKLLDEVEQIIKQFEKRGVS